MRTVTRLALVLALAGLGYVLYSWYWPGDEGRIQEALDDLAATVGEPGGDGLGQMARAARIGSFFARDVVIDLGQPYARIEGRDTLMALAAKMQVPGEGLDVRFVDVSIDVAPGGTDAVVHLTATVASRGRPFDSGLDAKELEMNWRKVDDTWLIAHVTGVSTLERPR
jgi:hypothetical protein